MSVPEFRNDLELPGIRWNWEFLGISIHYKLILLGIEQIPSSLLGFTWIYLDLLGFWIRYLDLLGIWITNVPEPHTGDSNQAVSTAIITPSKRITLFE